MKALLIENHDKITQGSAVITGSTGLSTWLGLIPGVMGAVASGVGIIVTVLLWRKQKQKLDLEIVALQLKIENLE